MGLFPIDVEYQLALSARGIVLKSCSAVIIVLALSASVMAQTIPAAPTPALSGPAFYQARLPAAPATIRAELDNLQKQKDAQHWSFGVGYTSVLDIPLSQLTGTRIPDNFEEIATRQNAFALDAVKLNQRLLSTKGIPVQAPGCVATAPAGSYEAKMTSVKMQGACGSCWDFSAMGAWEGTYSLRFNAKVDTSEQQVLTCSKAGTCAGGWWDPVYAWMIGTGVGTAAQTPYTGKDGPCVTHPPGNFKVAAWGFVTVKASIPSVSQLKQALSEHGPLVVAVYATPAFQAYDGTGVFNEEANNNGINHGVVIVGWDDSKGAWRMRNSWSTGWGDAGYMWIKYGSNNIGYAAAWVLPVAPRLVAFKNQQLLDLATKFNLSVQ